MLTNNCYVVTFIELALTLFMSFNEITFGFYHKIAVETSNNHEPRSDNCYLTKGTGI